MKKITLLLTVCLALTLSSLWAQKVAVVGMNHISSSPNRDGFSFVALQDLTATDIIYFTENEYDAGADAFTTGESHLKFEPFGLITKGSVVFVRETGTSTNVFDVICTGGGVCGTATNLSGSFSLSTNGDHMYAFEDTDDDISSFTEIYALMYTGSGEAPIQNGGNVPTNQNPVGDFPNAIVVDGFPNDNDDFAGPDRVEFKFSPATERENVSKAGLENPNNYVSYVPNQDLSTVVFTNVLPTAADPVIVLSASANALNEDANGTITLTATLDAPAASNLTVDLSIGGTAADQIDYTTSNIEILISSGATTGSITISPILDGDLEPDETVIVTIVNGAGYDPGSPSSQTVTILNDDTLAVTPVVAMVGSTHSPPISPESFSFVALDDIAANTQVYFTENPFDNNLLNFSGSEGVAVWTAPAGGVTRGQVIVVTEDSSNTFTTSCASGTCGTVTNVSGNWDLASNGEAIFAYSDSDTDHTNGIGEISSVLFTGTSSNPGGNIPASEDPSGIYLGSVVVDGFAAEASELTEYNPTLRGVAVDQANFQNIGNWVHSEPTGTLSTVPFSNIIIATGSADPSVTVTAAPTSALEDSGTGMVFTFTLSEAATADITVNFTVGGTAVFTNDITSDFSVGGAATFGATAGTILIPNGATAAQVTVTPLADADVETQETINLMVASGTGYVGGSPNDAEVSIINDDTSDSMPLVAIVGLNHDSSGGNVDGFSFVAARDIPANTTIYFTENEFDNTTLEFTTGEGVMKWVSPNALVPKGDVIVATETGQTADTFSMTCSGGTGSGTASCGEVTMVSGNFAIDTSGETFYAYEDDDDDPSNGVTDIYAVLYTGDSGGSSGGSLPSIQDPSGIFLNALVVDGFFNSPPNRTEYEDTKRNVPVNQANFEDISNWLFGQPNTVLSAVPFDTLDIVDTELPVVDCSPIDVTQNTDLGQCTFTMPGTGFDPIATDNVGVVTLVNSINNTNTLAGASFPLGTTQVIWTATDAAGNVGTCTLDIVISDDEVPMAVCQAITLELDPITGEVTLNPEDLDGGSTDNCTGTLTFTASQTLFTCADVGPNTVTLTVTDAAGKGATCDATVTIQDVTNPTLSCPPNVSRLSTTSVVLNAADIGMPTTGDNCGVATVVGTRTDTNSTDLFTDPYGQGITTITWVVTDNNGQTNFCAQTISVMPPPSMENAIVAMTVPNQVGTSDIDSGSFSVAAIVGSGTSLASIEPTITVSPDATISPTGPQNFASGPVIYTVTAEDGTPQTWSVGITSTEYTTAQDGDWDVATTWVDGAKPPNPIPLGTTVRVDHIVFVDTDKSNEGRVEIGVFPARIDIFIGNTFTNDNEIEVLPGSVNPPGQFDIHSPLNGTGTLTNTGSIIVNDIGGGIGTTYVRLRFEGILNNELGGLVELYALTQIRGTYNNKQGGIFRMYAAQNQVFNTLNNDGLVDLLPESTFSARNGGVVNNNTTGIIDNAGRFSVGFFSGTLNNLGTFNNALATSTLGAQNSGLGVGTINSTAGVINNEGVLDGSVGSVVNLSSAGLVGPGKVFAGRFSFSAANSTPGTLTIIGVLNNPAVMLTKINGTAAGDFSVIAVDGTADITGSALELVTTASSYTPTVGDEFEILTATGGVTGPFASTILPPLPNDLIWEVVYETNRVLLKVAPALVDLALEMSVDNTTPVVGDVVNFTVVVTNQGPGTATGVVVTDVVPSGLTAISVVISQGGLSSPLPSLVWTVGTLTPGQSETFTLSATVNASGDYLNLAEVTAQNETDVDSTPNNGVDTDSDTNTIDDPDDEDDGDGAEVVPIPLGCNPVPAPWTSADIGAVTAAGSACLDQVTGVFEIEGNGMDIWNLEDQFHFVYQEVTGDGEIIARVVSQDNTFDWAKAGIMMRESDDPGSKFVHMFMSPNPGGFLGISYALQDRPEEDIYLDASNNIGPVTTNTYGYYLRLVRDGDTFTGYASPTNGNWQLLGTRTVTMADNILVGLSVTSRADGVLNKSTFDNVSLSGFGPPCGGAGFTTYYADTDGDGFGDPNNTTLACTPPTGFVADNTDCDDTNDQINPGAAEVCDGLDNNCDGQIDEGLTLTSFYMDFDGDGFGDPVSEVQACSAPPGHVMDNTDCDDNNATVNPAAIEVCDGIDNNCNGLIDTDDPSLSDSVFFYADTDGDGFGDPNNSVQACLAPAGFVANNTDCDDTNDQVNPGASEVCSDGIDNNCNGQIDTNDVACQAGCNPVPAPWTSADIGDVGAAGSACFDFTSGTFEVEASGANIWNLADEFHYVYQPLDGDGEIIARVVSQENTFDWAKTGVMVRNGLDDGAEYGFMTAFPNPAGLGQAYAFQYRDQRGVYLDNTNNVGLTFYSGPPIYFRLVREGNTITGYASQTNGSWQLVGSATMALEQTVYIGLAMTSHVDGTIGKSVFDNVLVTSAQPPCGGAGFTTYYADSDGDGYGDPNNTTLACAAPTGFVADNTDCNDGDAAVNPGATEVCDGIDNNCDGNVDEGFAVNTYYADADSDGFGDPNNSTQSCSQPSGFVSDNTDCNDGDAAVNPGAVEICDGIDNNCDGNIDEGLNCPVGCVAVPSPWTSSDIGDVGAAGSACFDSATGTFEVEASGANIWNLADEFHYVYQPLNGDGEIIARVVSQDNTFEWAKTGVMVRNGLDDGAEYGFMTALPNPAGLGQAYAFQYRDQRGVYLDNTNNVGLTFYSGPPVYFRLVRQGNTITGYASQTNGNWQLVGSATMALEQTVYIGLAMTSHVDGTIGKSVFDNVSVSPIGIPLQVNLNNMHLYPNPATEAVQLEFDEPTQVQEFQVFDLLGRLVRTIKVDPRDAQHRMTVLELPVGTYFVKTTDAKGQQFQQQMVIKR